MQRHALLYDEHIRLGEDYAFYLRALLLGASFRLVSACGYVAVERPDSLSARHSAEDLRRIMAFDDSMLEAGLPLSASQRGALARHRAAMRNKFVYADALEKRKARGLAAGLARLTRSPAALPHVIAETARAKTHAVLSRLRPKFAPEQHRPRFLIGLPGAQFADIRPQTHHNGARMVETL